jgi:hypothetical protein
MFTCLRAIGIAVSVALCGCAGKPACDYQTPVGACSASVDPNDTWLLLKVEPCSQVELRVNNKARVIRTDSGSERIGSSDANVEVIGCLSYKDMRE